MFWEMWKSLKKRANNTDEASILKCSLMILESAQFKTLSCTDKEIHDTMKNITHISKFINKNWLHFKLIVVIVQVLILLFDSIHYNDHELLTYRSYNLKNPFTFLLNHTQFFLSFQSETHWVQPFWKSAYTLFKLT